MAYIGNQLSQIASTLAQFGATEGQFGLYFYQNTSDSLATVLGQNYISDGQKRGLQLGNFVIFYNGAQLVWLQVTALQATSSGYGVTLTEVADSNTGNPIVNTAISTVGAGTLSAAALVGGIVTRTGSTAAFTDTTDTAANIIAALYSQEISNSWIVDIINQTAFTETLAAGTGVTLSGITVVKPLAWVRALVTYSAAGAVTIYGFEAGANTELPVAQYSTAALQSTNLTVAQVSGSQIVCYDNTGTTPATLTTPTAAAIIANVPNAQVGDSWIFFLRNDSGSANTLTLGAGTNVTLTGTMTVAQNVTRMFVVTITSATAVTFQSMGIFAAGA